MTTVEPRTGGGRLDVHSLRQAIERAFADVKHPGPPQCIREYPCCPEHDAQAEWFSLHTWKDWAQGLAEDDDDPTGYFNLEPPAYRYFLPAILLFIIDNVERTEGWGQRVWRPIDWVYNALIPWSRDQPGLDWAADFRIRHLPLYSAAQKDVVIRVLEFVCATYPPIDEDATPFLTPPSPDEVREDIQAAIRSLWSEQARGAPRSVTSE